MLCLACALLIGVRWLQLPGVFQTNMDVTLTFWNLDDRMELTLGSSNSWNLYLEEV